MRRLVTGLVVFLDALPFALAGGGATYFGGSRSLGAARAGVMAAAVAVATLLLVGLVSYSQYRGSETRFWAVKKTVYLLSMPGW